MFGLLKKKISGFINNLLKKEEEKEPVAVEKETDVQSKETEDKKEKPVAKQQEGDIKKEKNPVPEIKNEQIDIEAKVPREEQKIEQKKGIVDTFKGLTGPKKIDAKRTERKKAQKTEIKKDEKPILKVGITKQIKSIFTGTIEISHGDVKDLLDSLELDLLESDVALEVAEAMKNDLELKLVGQKIKKEEINGFVRGTIRNAIVGIISTENSPDILSVVEKNEKPVKIMVIGTNGAGKTTTIAKIAKIFIDKGYKVAFAAGDTFRAAAIEQMSVHAERLGVKMIKREYGADPTSVAYDAVNYSKAHGIDVVIIDTAGRQDTNVNLINELKKMTRVISPDMKLYVGESIAGNAIIEQVAAFKNEIGIDGVILTKLDCDAKGGTVLSISKITGIPILYLGTGQKYEDLIKFEPERIAELILRND